MGEKLEPVKEGDEKNAAEASWIMLTGRVLGGKTLQY